MNQELLTIQNQLDHLAKKKKLETISLFPGIDLMYVSLEAESLFLHHKAADDIMQINYCKAGQITWKMKNGNQIYLNPGDFSLHRMDLCTDSALSFPTGQYAGLTIYVDLKEAASNPPELLRDTVIFRETLQKEFCREGTISFLAGNEQTAGIFSGFYSQREELKLPYQRLKVIELLLYLDSLKFSKQNELPAYQSEQVEIMREIHDRLIQNLGERVTIEELSREYLINPTTLKTAFKAVYGTSIAAHMKEHRMKMAANLLRDSDMSIAKIAQAVGYDSQSKFTAAFKATFHVLPTAYRKKG